MSRFINLAIDAMGGDRGPAEVIRGVAISLEQQKYPLRFTLFGKKDVIAAEVSKYNILAGLVEIVDCPEVIDGNDTVDMSLVRKKHSSLYEAIKAVRQQQCDGVVSNGNSAALIALAMLLLPRIPGVDRPAMVSSFPGIKGPIAFLDCGANLQTHTINLVQFAALGSLFSKIIHGIPNPRIGLINVGTEKNKGPDHVRQADQMLSSNNWGLNYLGYIESDKIAFGSVDVVVIDGYSGNILLKGVEGIGSFIRQLVYDAVEKRFILRIAGFFLKDVLRSVLKSIDNRTYNGALITGLNALVVKSHGSSDAYAFAQAINVAGTLVEEDFIEKAQNQISSLAEVFLPSSLTTPKDL